MLLDIVNAAVEQRLFTFNAQVKAGQRVHLVGPNGSGKSTLLALLAGLLNHKGTVTFAGRPLAEWPRALLARHRAWLPQQQPPPGQMPVWHYLLMHAQTDSRDRDALLSLAQTLQLCDKLTRPLVQLSGGEWQRVRLAAVMFQVSQPQGKLLLLDEPMTGLDIAQQAACDRLISSLTASGITVVMSSHDLNHTLNAADQVWLMRPQQAALTGPPQQILLPEHLSPLYGIAFRLLNLEGQTMLTTLS